MLLNLKAEYARKGKDPYKSVKNALSCAEKTARNKINGITEMTVSEALCIIDTDFKENGFSVEYLFENTNTTQPQNNNE